MGLAYQYLWDLSFMLAKKRNFFNNYEDYSNFAHYFAIDVYKRLTTDKQFLSPDDPHYKTPIKSCLNYMKNIIYARKCAYAYKEFNHTTKTEAEADAFAEYSKYNIVNNSHDTNMLYYETYDYLKSINSIVKTEIKNGIYGKDKLLSYKIYTSTLLSLLNNFTLSNAHKERLKRHLEANKADSEDLLARFVQIEADRAVLLYDLSDDYYDYVAYLVQRVKSLMIKDIKFLQSNYVISDTMIEDVMLSNIFKGEDDD